MKNIIIIGSRGYNVNYGKKETFVANLINNYKDEDTRFFVPELSYKLNNKIEIKNGVICKQIFIPKQGVLTMISFVMRSIIYYTRLIKKDKMKNTIMYFIGVRGGILLSLLHNKLKKMGVQIITNPGHLDWKRDAYPWFTRKWNKLSEKPMIKSSDLVICDNKITEKYIKDKYNVHTKYIPYGAYITDERNIDKKSRVFMEKHKISKREYYLTIGRFVPNNNFELIIKEFMLTDTNKELVIVSDLKKNKYYNKLLSNTNFTKDKRIKFVGSLYDKDILTRLRLNAKGYIHGNNVGGTNLTLLEALANTDINIVYDEEYNRDVCEDSVLYFTEEAFSLRDIIEKVDKFKSKENEEYSNKAKERVKNEFTWDLTINKYKKTFNNILK